jgi:hypothetical protein
MREWERDRVEAVVLACSGWPQDSLLGELRGRGLTAYGIGDCQAPRPIIHAVLDGARAARVI